MVPRSMKEEEPVEELKYAMKSWKPDWPCKLWKMYIAGVGFIRFMTKVSMPFYELFLLMYLFIYLLL